MTQEQTAFLEAFQASGLTINARFIPWSTSPLGSDLGPSGMPRYSLNWELTLYYRGERLLSLPYAQAAHTCPAFGPLYRPDGLWREDWVLVEAECEHGVLAQYKFVCPSDHPDRPLADMVTLREAFPILPDPIAMHSFILNEYDLGLLRDFDHWTRWTRRSDVSFDFPSFDLFMTTLRDAQRLRDTVDLAELAALYRLLYDLQGT